ncbi:WbqC-like protein [Ureibacillus chungkukjangi]|uniref:WbqC-like protein n=1 Tax=Ureibacillus chungkukjangi TaxID=1202712 RepID=A0A318TMH4_9BACL|nr:WbqC-like protein [Ureibacillus chungkukjangi]
MINNDLDWKEKILNQCFYYKNAPNYMVVRELLEESFAQSETNLSDFNTRLIKMICSYLGIDTNIMLFSENFPHIDNASESDDWGLHVSMDSNATRYINGIGGIEFYNQQKYLDEGIDIKFIQSKLTPYNQFDKNFVPGLSIIDIMMFNDLSTITEMLDQYELIS